MWIGSTTLAVIWASFSNANEQLFLTLEITKTIVFHKFASKRKNAQKEVLRHLAVWTVTSRRTGTGVDRGAITTSRAQDCTQQGCRTDVEDNDVPWPGE